MAKFKILVVDDDVNLSFLLQQRLESEGYEARSENSVPAGYLTSQSFKPDLVLTDINMGDQTGFDLMRRIRNHNPRIKTIYMTGDPIRYRSVLEQEHKQHHAMCLSKPFSEHKLLESISAAHAGRDQIAA
ncbi:MAG: response regulator [Candidatus Binatia bacterium]